MRLRINEAIARAADNGKKVWKKELAAQLFPDCSEQAQRVKLTLLCSGKTERVKPETIITICKVCECSLNFLFGLEDNQ